MTTCADLPSRGNTAKALRAMCERCPNEMICTRDGWVLQNCAIRARVPGTYAALDAQANMDATVWHNRQAGAVCEPPAYDCVPPEEPAAKGCHGCRFAFGMACTAITPASSLSLGIRVRVEEWITNRLGPDLLTPKPNAPECPGRAER